LVSCLPWNRFDCCSKFHAQHAIDHNQVQLTVIPIDRGWRNPSSDWFLWKVRGKSDNALDNHWLVVWNMAFIFHFIYGIILPIFPHKNIFQDGYCTTNQISVIAYVMFFDLALPSARLVLFHRALWPEIEDRVLAADFTNGMGIEWRCHWECRPKKDRKHRKQHTHTLAHVLFSVFTENMRSSKSKWFRVSAKTVVSHFKQMVLS